MLKKQNYKKGKLVLNHQIKKQAESQVRGAANFVGCENSHPVKFPRLQKFAPCENSQAAKFAGCQILQPPKFPRLLLQSSINLLQNSSELNMSLRIQLMLDVFKSN